ncbi:LysR family transcriptional regulator [Serratia marcescens]|uniref:LysR family transcriptional regulator n=1 Tax=Serratia marcescens TaxID=615 RepID=UPI003EE2A13F
MTHPKRPPPLQLLPAFEAAARLLSFSKAAQELHLTTSAISQQIRQLETLLGQPLFRRLELTPAGQMFAATTVETLTVYRRGFASSSRKRNPNAVSA